MAYQKLPLLDGETVIDKELLDHIQDGIVNADRRIDSTNDTLQRLEDSQAYIVLDDESSAAAVTNAIAAYRTGANVFWQESSELCGVVGAIITPPALYFMKTSKNRIVKVSVQDNYIVVSYYRTTGDSIQAVQTATEMESILTTGNRYDVGTFYMYLGETTTLNGRTYKQGAVYRLGEK